MKWIGAALLAFLPLAALAVEPLRFTGIDLLVEGRSNIGQLVTVDRCVLEVMNERNGLCVVYRGDHDVGRFWVQTRTMERTALRRALTDCNGVRQLASCSVSLTGRIYDSGTGLEFRQSDARWLVP